MLYQNSTLLLCSVYPQQSDDHSLGQNKSFQDPICLVFVDKYRCTFIQIKTSSATKYTLRYELTEKS